MKNKEIPLAIGQQLIYQMVGKFYKATVKNIYQDKNQTAILVSNGSNTSIWIAPWQIVKK